MQGKRGSCDGSGNSTATGIIVADLRILEDHSKFNIIELPRQQGYFFCRPGHPLCRVVEPTAREIGLYPLAIMWMPEFLRKHLIGLLNPEAQDLSALTGCPVFDEVHHCRRMNIIWLHLNLYRGAGPAGRDSCIPAIFEGNGQATPIPSLSAGR